MGIFISKRIFTKYGESFVYYARFKKSTLRRGSPIWEGLKNNATMFKDLSTAEKIVERLRHKHSGIIEVKIK